MADMDPSLHTTLSLMAPATPRELNGRIQKSLDSPVPSSGNGLVCIRMRQNAGEQDAARVTRKHVKHVEHRGGGWSAGEDFFQAASTAGLAIGTASIGPAHDPLSDAACESIAWLEHEEWYHSYVYFYYYCYRYQLLLQVVGKTILAKVVV